MPCYITSRTTNNIREVTTTRSRLSQSLIHSGKSTVTALLETTHNCRQLVCMYPNWTSYVLYNWSNITRWNAWLCGISLREQHAAGGRRNSTVYSKLKANLNSVVPALAAFGRVSLCVFTLKAAQPLGTSAYFLSCQLGLGMSCTLLLQSMFIPTTILSLKLLAYPTYPFY